MTEGVKTCTGSGKRAAKPAKDAPTPDPSSNMMVCSKCKMMVSAVEGSDPLVAGEHFSNGNA